MLLETQRLSKSFGGLRAVDEVDFAVAAGSITGIIGPNGAGKTTFFNVISRALPASSGRIVFDGQDVTTLQAHQVARLGVARTFQATTLFERCHGARERAGRLSPAHQRRRLGRAGSHRAGWRAKSTRPTTPRVDTLDFVGLARSRRPAARRT